MIASNIELDMRGAVEGLLRRIANTARCQECDDIVELLTVKEASNVSGANQATLLLWILQKRIHCLDQRGRLMICARSLQRGEAVTGDLDLKG